MPGIGSPSTSVTGERHLHPTQPSRANAIGVARESCGWLNFIKMRFSWIKFISSRVTILNEAKKNPLPTLATLMPGLRSSRSGPRTPLPPARGRNCVQESSSPSVSCYRFVSSSSSLETMGYMVGLLAWMSSWQSRHPAWRSACTMEGCRRGGGRRCRGRVAKGRATEREVD